MSWSLSNNMIIAANISIRYKMPVSLPTAIFIYIRKLSDEPQRLPRTVGLRQLQE